MARGGPLVGPPAGIDPDEDTTKEVFNFRITGPYAATRFIILVHTWLRLASALA